MKDCLNIFGMPFAFTIFHKQKYFTIIGLICSILTFISMIIFCYFFGKDFFLRQNPQTIFSKQKPTNYSYHNITQDIFYFPWRINDKNGNAVDFHQLVYPFLHYEQYVKDPISKESKYTTEILKYSKCKPNPEYQNNSGVDIENYYCFDFDELKIGGSHDTNEFYYLSLYLSYCPNGGLYYEDTCNTDDLLELYTILGSESWSLSFIYPEYNFEPDSINVPLRIIYKFLTLPLNIFLMKEHFFSFQFVKITDDQGLIISNEKTTSKFAVYEMSSDNRPSDFLFEGTSSVFYKISLSISKDNDQYSRRYTKLPDVLANIGGILRIVIFAFEIICLIVNESFLYSSLLYHFFSFEIIKKNFNNNNTVVTLITSLNSQSITKSLVAAPKTNTFIKASTIKAEITKDNKQINNLKNISTKNEKEKKENSLFFSLYLIRYIMLKSCYDKSTKEKLNCRYQAFLRALSALKSRIEITDYIRFVNETEILKKEIMNKKMYDAIISLERTNPYNPEDVNTVYTQLLKFKKEHNKHGL